MKALRITFSMLLMMFIAIGLSFGQEARPSGNTGSGPFVKNGKLYDKNGCLFVPRGVNLPAAWHDYSTNGTMYSELDNLAAWGFNSVRIVWSAGISGSGTEDWSHNQVIIYNIIEKCIQEGMIPMLELHDGTGSNRTDWLAQMAQWFANNKNWLDDFDDNLIINIANEWGNYSLAATTWRDAYQNAITTIRNSGLKNCLVIDGKNYAKDISVIQSYGNTLVNHDPEHNIAFGVHYYCGTGESSTTIRNNLEWADNNGICLMVGEFAAQHDNFNGGMCNVQEETIINECNQNGQGYYWWAWETGNDGVFDLTTVWNSTSYNQLTALGKWLIVDSPDGIQQTSVKASNLGGPACSGGGGTDAITSVSGPTTVAAGENINVQVGYEASTNRDLYVSIQLNESPWTTYGTEKVDVSNGTGSANVSLTIDNAAPAGTNYKYQTYITTDGGGWTERLADDLQAGITISDGPGNEHPIPGKIEAEAYTSMSGIQTQTTTDVGGGENVGWVNAGDWLDYDVNVASAGQYDVTFRLASLSNGANFDLKDGSTVLTSVNEPATGGWQTWTSVTKTVTLSAGSNTIRILATGDGWNINWMDLTETSAPATYSLSVTNGSGDGDYEAGTVVNISADAAPNGQEFDVWTGDIANVADINNANTSITMPSANTSITATYKDIIIGDGTITVRAILTNGSSDVLELRLDDITVKSWTISNSWAEYSYSGISGSKEVKIHFQDNGTDAKLDYINVSGTIYQAEDQAENTSAWDGTCGGGSFTENLHCPGYIGFGTINFGGDTPIPTYTLSVTNGSGDGDYEQGTVVNITANAAPTGQVFAGWTGDISYLNDANSSSTTVTMPASNVSVTATYQDQAPSNKYEAEDATLTGCSTASTVSGFSGTGYVDGTTFTSPDKISWTVNGIAAGNYDIIIGYNGAFGAKEQELIINGSSKGNIQFNNISEWATVNAGNYSLNTNNTIELKASWGWMHVDYIELVSLKSGVILSNEEADSDKNSILIYPNPVKQSENVYLKHTFDDVVIRISDVQGKLIHIQKYQNEKEITIPTENLKEGLYILQVNESVRKLMIK